MSYYQTNLTDKQWQVIKNMLEIKERRQKHFLRDLINAMMYLTETNCQWWMFPKDFGFWQMMYFYSCKWKFGGIFEVLMHFLAWELSVVLSLINLLFLLYLDAFHYESNISVRNKFRIKEVLVWWLIPNWGNSCLFG